MTINELRVGQKVRVPASEKNGGGNHYALVTDITKGWTGEDLVIIWIPVLKIDKAVSPALLLPLHNPTINKPDKAGGAR